MSEPTATPAVSEPARPRRCENCGAQLLGEHCYACGQSTRGLVRHFSSIMGDFFDTVLNIDSRVIRTIWPLFAKPGYLTMEYIAGRRVRYVTPVRLFFFLTIVMFFAIHGSLEVGDDGDVKGVQVGAAREGDSIANAMTVAELEKALAASREALQKTRESVAGTPGATVGIDVALEKIEERGRERLEYLKAVEAAKAAGKPPPKEPRGESLNFPVNGKNWDPDSNPINFGWLPAAANRSLNERMRHARDEMDRGDSEKTIVDAIFRVLPQALFVLMPIFALLLKAFFVLKRRLYMEHLLVALHSHSFMALDLTLIVALATLQEWLFPESGFFNGLLGWGIALLSLWIPLYLLLMQKRVYGQGWLMTLFKFWLLGTAYSFMLGCVVLAALFIGLLTL
ncbi:DUF3667 domain-containing protein [Arenimonas sp.]|uniref:DUF3667 domain-containing protein n=1 Tax=Arenimonas sp. TaxID=1872635 RepID=UPI0039E21BC6